jgi:undecaprenyl-diphosphatase
LANDKQLFVQRLIAYLKNIDTNLFLFLNGFRHPLLDTIMHWASHNYFWIWLYAILLIVLYRAVKKKILFVLLLAAVTITLSDQTSSATKKYTKRYRPCHNLSLQHRVNVNGKCGGQYGFVSSHAANSFALATLIALFLYKRKKLLSILIFDWAILVSLSRIYNGVHYPLDLIGGALLGVSCALVTFGIYKWLDKHYSADSAHT